MASDNYTMTTLLDCVPGWRDHVPTYVTLHAHRLPSACPGGCTAPCQYCKPASWDDKTTGPTVRTSRRGGECRRVEQCPVLPSISAAISVFQG